MASVEGERGGALESISHELRIRCDKDDDAASTQQSILTVTNGETCLNLAQGENWLRLVASLGGNSALQDTQETSTMETKPFPSISSLNEVGTIPALSEDCYICIDVDGPYVSIKDMRAPISSQESEEEEEAMFDVCIGRRKQQHETELAINSQEQGIAGKYHALEALERRQLRMLHKGDCIVIRNSSATGGSANNLVLEYHQCRGEPRARGASEEMTQGSEIVEENTSSAVETGNTEDSKPSERPQTQPSDPRLSDYQTAVESQPTHESDDEETSYEGDEGEATQVFPRSTTVLSTQSPERERESDDETAMDVDPPESEKEQTFMTPAGRESELVAMGTQPQENGETRTAEIERRMAASTQSISSGTDEENNSDGRGGNKMSPIVEETVADEGNNGSVDKKEIEATTNGSGANDKPVAKPPSQASTTLEESQKGEDSDDETTVNEEEAVEEKDDGSDSDALLDDDDIKDASADVPKTPQKTHSASDADKATTASKEKDEPVSGAPANEDMSDSSSITEIDEETPVKSKPNESVDVMEDDKQKREVTAAAAEPAPGTGDDASRASSITEPGDLISPREGLVTVSGCGKSESDESLSGETNEPASETLGDQQDDDREKAAVALAGFANTDAQNGPNQEKSVSKNSSQEEEAPEEAAVDGDTATKPSEASLKEKDNEPDVDSAAKDERAGKDGDTDKVSNDSSETDRAESAVTGQTSEEDDKAEKVDVPETDEVNVEAPKPPAEASKDDEKDSPQSPVPKDSLPHSEETQITNNKSASVDRYKSSDDKAVAVELQKTATDNVEEEAKGTKVAEEDMDSPLTEKAAVNKPAESAKTNKADEQTASPDATEASAKEHSVDSSAMKAAAANEPSPSTKADKDGVKEAEQETSPGSAESLKKEAATDSTEAATGAKPSRPKRGSRKKIDEEDNDDTAAKPPAKKKARSTRTKPKPEPEEETENSLKTPAKNKRTRAAGHGLRGSARKRTRAGAGTPTTDGHEPVRVVMTGVAESEKEKKMIASIGGELIEKVEDAHTATHVIAGDDKNSLRRTPKLMIGICRTSNIVHLDWLIKSAKVKQPLACNDFLLLKDKKAERQYGFKMREALQRGEALRSNDEFLLSGYWVYVCNGVAGNKAPPEKEFELIVDGAGGKWLSSIGTRVMKDLDASKLIIITPEKPSKKKSKSAESKDVEKAIKLGAQDHPPSWLFQCIIRQKLD